jgi:hypothetical protein
MRFLVVIITETVMDKTPLPTHQSEEQCDAHDITELIPATL